MPSQLPPELYYLSNFRTALAWVGERYADLLSIEERAFIDAFHALHWSSQALLVRMIMRKGSHFRLSKLDYPEIGDSATAADALFALDWITAEAVLGTDEVAALLRKDELLNHLPLADRRSSQKKSDLVDQLLTQGLQARSFEQWCPSLDDSLLSLQVGELCDRLRLMFFGNLGQDWSEFVLADLGIYRYETVAINPASRGFQSRQDIDDYLHLRELRAGLEQGAAVDDIQPALLAFSSCNPYLCSRQARLIFQLAQQLEKHSELQQALLLYQHSQHAQSRWRQIRVLEQLGCNAQAYALATAFNEQPGGDEERQRLERALTRLRRKLGLASITRPKLASASRIELTLAAQSAVEVAVRKHFHTAQTPVYYVENSLFCSLFGLLCWEAIFAPLPGAFFHPFHSGPVDLYTPEFYPRRRALFDECLARLHQPDYRQLILERYQDKLGIQSPFVFWAVLDETLLELALQCIPADHLHATFTRMLRDLKANRSGMPDLIQFFPAQQGYRMIEVKGPGDRLQDNQKRWLGFAAEQGIAVEVCYVNWAAA